jgi:hypothetical protein
MGEDGQFDGASRPIMHCTFNVLFLKHVQIFKKKTNPKKKIL